MVALPPVLLPQGRMFPLSPMSLAVQMESVRVALSEALVNLGLKGNGEVQIAPVLLQESLGPSPPDQLFSSRGNMFLEKHRPLLVQADLVPGPATWLEFRPVRRG
jgi:hypothetical protein